jgi:hypothetical protein
MTASNSTVTCFVISPIGEDGTPERSRADQVFRHLIGKTLLPPAYVVVRGDHVRRGAVRHGERAAGRVAEVADVVA